MAYLIGVDGGTESIRAIVFDLEGRPMGSHASAYETQFPKPSWAEQNPEDWWRCIGAAVRGAVNAASISAAGRARALRRYHLLFGAWRWTRMESRCAPR